MGNGVCGCGGVSEPSPAGEEAEWGGSFPGMASADVSGCCSEGRFGAGFRRRYGLRFGLRFGVRFGRVGGCRKRGEGGKEEGRKRGSKGASGRGALRVLPRKLRPSFPAGVDRTRHYVVVHSPASQKRSSARLTNGRLRDPRDPTGAAGAGPAGRKERAFLRRRRATKNNTNCARDRSLPLLGLSKAHDSVFTD